MKGTQIVVFLFVLICSVASTSNQKLQFREDGTFTILQITDLHYGESDELDNNSTILQGKLMDYEKPDFLAYTGDMVAGYSWNKTKGWYKAMWSKWTKAATDRKIPYGYTLGNHDSEADLKRREIVELDKTNPNSHTEMSPTGVEGASNFVVPVFSSKDPNTIVTMLWFFDSGDYDCLGVHGYGCVDSSMIQWYRETSKHLEEYAGRKIPGIAFMHIAPQEYMYAYNHYPSVGNKTEHSGCSSMNTGIIASFKQRGDVFALFVGHDHANDYVNDFEGILLGYGRKTGYGCYGPPKGMQRGGRILKLREEEFHMDSFIIQEDGTRQVQTGSVPQVDPQTVCNRCKPPK